MPVSALETGLLGSARPARWPLLPANTSSAWEEVTATEDESQAARPSQGRLSLGEEVLLEILKQLH